MIWLQIAVLFCLVFICYQDILYRAVYWICFPVLAILLMGMKYKLLGIEQTLLDAGYGALFLVFQLCILWIYFSVKNKRIVNLTEEYLGWGDILFLVVIVFYLSPVNYVVFYVLSLIMVLLYVATTNVLSKKANKQIPLAGLQAVLLAVLLLMEMYVDRLRLYEDSWIYFFVG